MTVIQEPPTRVETTYKVDIIFCDGRSTTPQWLSPEESKDMYVDMIEHGLQRTVVLDPGVHIRFVMLTITRGRIISTIDSGEMVCGCE